MHGCQATKHFVLLNKIHIPTFILLLSAQYFWLNVTFYRFLNNYTKPPISSFRTFYWRQLSKELALFLASCCMDVRTDPLQYWHCNLLLTDTSVTAILASGFTYSVYPCLRVFHETPTMHVANSQHATTIQHAPCCPIEREISVVAFLLVTFNSSGITMVAHFLEVVSKYEECIRSMQKEPRFSHRRRMVRADGDHL